MSFSEGEKVDIRRFCGYPVFGATTEYAFGYRYFGFYGLLEFRLNHLKPEEEVIIREMVADLKNLYADIYSARDNLDTDRAAVWYHNRQEVDHRTDLYERRRRTLCDTLGIPYRGADSTSVSGSSYNVRLYN